MNDTPSTSQQPSFWSGLRNLFQEVVTAGTQRYRNSTDAEARTWGWILGIVFLVGSAACLVSGTETLWNRFLGSIELLIFAMLSLPIVTDHLRQRYGIAASGKQRLVVGVMVCIALSSMMQTDTSATAQARPAEPSVAKQAAADDDDYPSVMATGRGYLRDKTGDDVLAFTSQQALDAAMHTFTLNDRIGFDEIFAAAGMLVPKNTGILYLDSSGWLDVDFKVRIMEGTYYGRAVWVKANWVHTRRASDAR